MVQMMMVVVVVVMIIISFVQLGQSSLSKNWRSLFRSHFEQKIDLSTVLRSC